MGSSKLMPLSSCDCTRCTDPGRRRVGSIARGDYKDGGAVPHSNKAVSVWISHCVQPSHHVQGSHTMTFADFFDTILGEPAGDCRYSEESS